MENAGGTVTDILTCTLTPKTGTLSMDKYVGPNDKSRISSYIILEFGLDLTHSHKLVHGSERCRSLIRANSTISLVNAKYQCTPSSLGLDIQSVEKHMDVPITWISQ